MSTGSPLANLRVPPAKYIVLSVGCFVGLLWIAALSSPSSAATASLSALSGRLLGSDGTPTSWLGGVKNGKDQVVPQEELGLSSSVTNSSRVNAAFVILARNSDVWSIVESIRGMEGESSLCSPCCAKQGPIEAVRRGWKRAELASPGILPRDDRFRTTLAELTFSLTSSDRFNGKGYHYPYVFLNDEPFSEESDPFRLALNQAELITASPTGSKSTPAGLPVVSALMALSPKRSGRITAIGLMRRRPPRRGRR